MTDLKTLPTEKIYFSVKKNHSVYTGYADIHNFYTGGTLAAFEFFNTNDFTTNKIGTFENYSIFENYIDSGSIDYYYFAIENV